MKRLFALTGFVYISVQTAAFYVSPILALIVAAVGALAGIVFLFLIKDKYKKKTVCTACITAVIAGLVFYVYSQAYFIPEQTVYDNKEVTVNAQLSEEPHKSYNTYYYELTAKSVNGKDENFKILLKSATQLEIEPFDYITCTATLEKCDNNYYMAQGFLYTSYASYEFDYDTERPESLPPYSLAINVRNAMESTLDILLPERLASFSKAIALGDRFSLDTDTRADFSKTGISYIIVVSGMHLAIVSSFVIALLSKIFKNRYVTYIGTVLTVMSFMAVTGFLASVMRAGIMIIIYLFGKMIFYQADSLNSLGFATLCLCVHNPFAAGDIGLLLSVSATLGIILLSNKINNFAIEKLKSEKLKLFLNYPVKILSLTLSAFLFTVPITLLAFGTFSPIVFVASLIITPVVGVLVICILICSILYCTGLLSVLAYPFAFVICVISGFIIFVVNVLADLNISTIYISHINAVIFLSASAILIAMALIFKDYKHKLKYSFIMIGLVALTGYAVSFLPKSDKLEIINTNNGTTVLLDTYKGLAVLSCGGELAKTNDVISGIAQRNSEINFLSVLDNNKQSSAYASGILEEFDCLSVLLYDTDRTNEETYRRARECDEVMTFSENQSVQAELWKDVTVNAFNIEGNTFEYISSEDYSILIIPQKADCTDIPENYLTADIIISSACPENYQMLKCDTFVYTGDEEKLSNYTRSFATFSDKIATTVNDNVTITLN